MALIEAMVMGGLAGATVESCKRGLVKQWGRADELPPLVKALVIGCLIVVPAINAGTLGNYVPTALATVGAFTVARWSVASVIVLWRWRARRSG